MTVSRRTAKILNSDNQILRTVSNTSNDHMYRPAKSSLTGFRRSLWVRLHRLWKVMQFQLQMFDQLVTNVLNAGLQPFDPPYNAVHTFLHMIITILKLRDFRLAPYSLRCMSVPFCLVFSLIIFRSVSCPPTVWSSGFVAPIDDETLWALHWEHFIQARNDPRRRAASPFGWSSQ